MTIQTLWEAQDYLTMMKHGDLKLIVDIQALSKKHTTDEIISFLKDYNREKEKALRNLILIDKFNRRVDETVAVMFRLSMAIRTLEDDSRIINISDRKEVKQIVQLKHGTEKSGRVLKRYRRCHRGPRIGKDQMHDGKNRDVGQGTQRAA